MHILTKTDGKDLGSGKAAASRATAHMFATHSTAAIEQGCLQHRWTGMNDHSSLNVIS